MDIILFQSLLAFAIASLFAGDCGRDGAGISSRLFSAPAVTTCVTSPGNGIHRSDLGGCDYLPAQVPAMNTENGTNALTSGRHAHKSQSPGSAAMRAPRHIRRLNSAKRLKCFSKIADGDIRCQIAHTDNHFVPLSSASNTCLVKACQSKEMIRETGLEAGDAIFGKRSCFKASSGDHPRFKTTLNHSALYGPMAHTQAIFSVVPPKYLQNPGFGPQTGMSHRKSALLQTNRSLERYKGVTRMFQDGFLMMNDRSNKDGKYAPGGRDNS